MKVRLAAPERQALQRAEGVPLSSIPDAVCRDRLHLRGQLVSCEAFGAASDKPQRDEPDDRSDRDADGQVEEQQSGGLSDGEEDQREDHGAAELVRLLARAGSR